jgi:hypothetical protein
LCPRWGDNHQKGIRNPNIFFAGEGGSFFMNVSVDFIKSCGDNFELMQERFLKALHNHKTPSPLPPLPKVEGTDLQASPKGRGENFCKPPPKVEGD